MSEMLQFCNVIKKISTLLDLIISLENKKLDTIITNNVAQLDSIMKEEEVVILQFRGLEKKREMVQKDLGFPSLSFREIVEQSTPPHKETLTMHYQDINEKMKEVKAITDCTKKHIELHLHSLDILITNFQKEKTSTNYTKTGEKKPREMAPKFTQTKI